MRPSGRAPDQMRPIAIETNFTIHAEGSVLVSFGDTKVLVTASVDEKVPPFLRGKGEGWVTAEYGMLPRATHTRGQPRSGEGQAVGPDAGNPAAYRPQLARRRRHEKARRASDHHRLRRDPGRWRHPHRVDLGRVGRAAPRGRQAARSASSIAEDPIEDKVGAISCGIYKGTPVLDLDYDEDSVAEADGNFVLTGKGQIVEVQASAEGATYDEEGLLRLLRLARIGCNRIFEAQLKAVQ
jgi:ribonuclease PH